MGQPHKVEQELFLPVHTRMYIPSDSLATLQFIAAKWRKDRQDTPRLTCVASMHGLARKHTPDTYLYGEIVSWLIHNYGAECEKAAK